LPNTNESVIVAKIEKTCNLNQALMLLNKKVHLISTMIHLAPTPLFGLPCKATRGLKEF
jgi:hypothetical protein